MIRVVFQTVAGEVEHGPFEKVTLGGIRCDLLVAGDEVLARRPHAGELWESPDGTGVGAVEFVRVPSRSEVMLAVNEGVDLAMDAIGAAGYYHMGPDQAQNIACLVVNAIATVLDTPGADMAAVMAGNFDASTIGDWREELGDGIVDEALRRCAE